MKADRRAKYMAKSTGRRGYNAYLRKAKKRFGVTHSQARKMYRLQSEKAGGPINSRELDKHPIVSKRIAIQASKPEKRASKHVVQKREQGASRQRSAAAPSGGKQAAPARRVTTIRQWEQYYDEADEYEDLIVEAGVDTGKEKGKR
jgi:hypothetical protein